jgi:hypothetical protein
MLYSVSLLSLVPLVLSSHHSLTTSADRRSSLPTTTLLIPSRPKCRHGGLRTQSPHVPALFPVSTPQPSSAASATTIPFRCRSPPSTSGHPGARSRLFIHRVFHWPSSSYLDSALPAAVFASQPRPFITFPRFHLCPQPNIPMSLVHHISSPEKILSLTETTGKRILNQSIDHDSIPRNLHPPHRLVHLP